MPTSNLRQIRAFPELVRYLEEQLDWPLNEYGFDELTFEYTPGELGLKEEDAARIKAIHQLRPLANSQPWGIFFVEFENKKLPVVVLRRILSHLALKKRASANKASAPAWHADDLLFITAFGEDGTDAREIAFAHFHQNPGDMPTLHVLGWDGGDTPLKLANVDHVLRERLHWPDDEKDTQAWRETWSKPFRHRIGHVITTASILAEELASLARGIRDKAKVLLAAESEKGEITKLFKAFQTALIHDLTPESFADTYAQTITYGLLTAAISRTDTSEGRYGTFVKADDIAEMVPITNPFLKEMLQTFLKVGGRKGGIDFDELGIQDVVELLRGDETDLPAILRDFGNKTRGEDPVIHFYEHFLSAYNKKLKIQRGVFYTPQPVVSYIVRSVHELLQTEFGLEDGLASTITWGGMLKKHPDLKLPPLTDTTGEKRTISPDEPFVVILDPATGTATFLVEVISVIHRTLTEKWTKQGMNQVQRLDAWNDYVPAHLLPRLYGYELMMAPYAIAHMKIGLNLSETGYRFLSNERVRIYLTNALEPWQRQLKLPDFEALAHEAVAVNEVKREKRFTVIIGNPPYSGVSANNSDTAVRLVDAYKIVDGEALGERKHWLQDDYVKFIRVGQMIVEVTGCGILSYISNHGYLDNTTFRGMRQSLLRSFHLRQVVDLHGNSKKKETAPDGSSDENVFDIQQGVAICFLVRFGSTDPSNTSVVRGDLFGSRSSKYKSLSSAAPGSLSPEQLCPNSPFYLFVRQDQTHRQEFEVMQLLSDIMLVHSVGVVTARDHLTIAHTADELWERVRRFSKLTEHEARTEYDLRADVQNWKVGWAQEDVRKSGPNRRCLYPILYRPFDLRHIYYTGRSAGFICRPMHEVMQHMIAGNNLGIMTTRKVEIGTFGHVVCANRMTESHSVSLKEVNYLFPLWLYPDGDGLALSKEARPNFTPQFLRAFAESLDVRQAGVHGLPAGLTPEDIFHYAYAVFHSPIYRSRYAEFLKIDFPRLPLTGNLELFRALSRLGGELVALHLLESPKLDQPTTEFIGGKNPEVEKPSWSDNTVWVDKVQTIGFKGVREEVWNFHIGGYQVCQKWLKDRKGRMLSKDDIAHYQKIVIALSETIRLMAEIDRVIETHGGWPDAFASAAGQDANAATDEASVEELIAPPPASVAKKSRVDHVPDLFSSAPDVKPKSEPTPPAPRTTHADDYDRDELCAEIRKLFNDGAVRERDAAIDELAHALGHQRTGKNIRETLDNALRTAVRRGILDNEGSHLKLRYRNIEQHEADDRDAIKEQFLASLGGRAWTERDDAIQSFARWMGFRRTGATIDETVRSLINGLLREHRLESDGSQIRRTG